jgi:transcriptional regulator with XRE-family HTH domain
MNHFGELLRETRKQARISQQALADEIGVDDSYISKMEKGVDRSPSREVALRLADALGLSDGEDRIKFLSAAGVVSGEDLEGFALIKIEDGQASKEEGRASGALHFPQPRRMEKERVIQEVSEVLNKAEVSKEAWQETLKLLGSFLGWLNFRLEEVLSFAKRLYLQITGPASEVQSFFDEVEAGKHDDLKVVRAPREYTNMFARRTLGYEARLYGAIEFTAPVAEKLAHDYVKRLIEERFPQSSIEIKISEDVENL